MKEAKPLKKPHSSSKTQKSADKKSSAACIKVIGAILALLLVPAYIGYALAAHAFPFNGIYRETLTTDNDRSSSSADDEWDWGDDSSSDSSTAEDSSGDTVQARAVLQAVNAAIQRI